MCSVHQSKENTFLKTTLTVYLWNIVYITDPVGNLDQGQKKPELISDSNFASSSISDKTCNKDGWCSHLIVFFLSSQYNLEWLYSQHTKKELKQRQMMLSSARLNHFLCFQKVGMALASYIIELLTSTLEECSKDVPLTLEPSVPCLSLQTWTSNTFFKTPKKYWNTFKISKVFEDLSTEPLVGAACCWEGGGARPRMFVTWQWCKWWWQRWQLWQQWNWWWKGFWGCVYQSLLN